MTKIADRTLQFARPVYANFLKHPGGVSLAIWLAEEAHLPRHVFTSASAPVAEQRTLVASIGVRSRPSLHKPVQDALVQYLNALCGLVLANPDWAK